MKQKKTAKLRQDNVSAQVNKHVSVIAAVDEIMGIRSDSISHRVTMAPESRVPKKSLG